MRQLRLLIGTLVTVGLLAGLVVSPAYADPPFDPPGLDRAMTAQEAHTDALLGIQGVVGTAVGLAEGGPVIKILTEHPGVAGLPRTLDGITVEVQVTGKLFALHHCKGKHAEDPVCGTSPGSPDAESDCSTTERCPRPVPIGVSTGHPDITAGTIGARVIDSAGYVYALSNNHVYANENNATTIGDDPENPDNVLQPGDFDGGADPADAIGQLEDFVAINFNCTCFIFCSCTPPDNTIDAAIARSSTDLLGNATPSNGYGTPKSATIPATIGQKVQKYGRTTSLTKGEVTGINATVVVGYDSGVARFVDQIIISSRRAFIKGGDSGSLLVTHPSRLPVGLLFAGNSTGKTAIANPIVPVLSALGATGVAIDGE